MLSWRIGEVRITRVVELTMSGEASLLLPAASAEALLAIPWLRPDFVEDDGRYRTSVHALVIETPERRMVVDTCIGGGKGREAWGIRARGDRFLAEMVEAGYPPDSIDTVLCTHLHFDHVGWNTRWTEAGWRPTFPQARYLFGRAELAYWSVQQASAPDREVFADSVQPVLDAGLADLVEPDHQLCDEVRLVPTPGHSVGHVSVAIASRGEQALITGDFVHHPCQLARPDWGSAFDHDAAAGAETRRRMFAALAETPTLVIGTHFAAPTAGRIVRDGAVWRLAC